MSELSEKVIRMTGRRDRNMQAKQARILDAASALFDEKGFAAVTTQQISERADVAAGTLFRYAASKGELLLMVYNDLYRAAIDEGAAAAASASGAAAAIEAFIAPVIEWSRRHTENSTAYQRELLFGEPTERFRSEGLALVAEFEARITALLLAERADAEDEARAAADAIFAIVHLAISRTARRPHGDEDAARLHRQIGQIITGFRAHPRSDA